MEDRETRILHVQLSDGFRIQTGEFLEPLRLFHYKLRKDAFIRLLSDMKALTVAPFSVIIP